MKWKKWWIPIPDYKVCIGQSTMMYAHAYEGKFRPEFLIRTSETNAVEVRIGNKWVRVPPGEKG